MKKTHLLALLAIPALLTLTGCAGWGMTPSRTNNVSISLDECTVTINEPDGKHPAYPRSLQIGVADLQVANDGDETTSPANPVTISPTTNPSLTLPLQ